MATYTTNLNLKKPEGTDYVLIGDLNGNMDNLDNTIGKLSQLNTANRTNLVEAINEANAGVTNLPYIGENGNWYEWDAANAQYIDSGVPAQGGQGAPGADGQPGKDGAAATIAIGTVTEGDAAGVTNSGTESAAILDFVLPRGRDGENGSDGVAATVQVGTVAEGDAASVTNSGTESAAVLDFVIPRGRDGTDGQPGADGQPGQAATIQIGTVTGGDAPSVTNSGTENAAVLDFVLQRGPQGETGRGFKVLGYYATLEALEADVSAPEVGDAYGVGAAAPYDIYIWDGVTLSWANNGALQGAKGDDGAAATITIGTVTDGEAAAVTNSGTAQAAVLDFVIPRGQDGQPGADGPPGADGQPGAAAGFGVPTITAAALAAGAEPTASVVATGPDTAKVFAFELGIPAGQDGAPGADGSPGADGRAATIEVGTVATGEPGTEASVTNSGTESAAVLDFVIPRGEGTQGEPGPNLLSGETATELNGVLRGNGANVTVAEDVISYGNLVGQTASGKLVTLNNVLPSAPLSGLTVQGWSTQAAAPSVDAPVAIDSLELSEVRVCGKNLLDPANMPATQTVTGITFTNLGYAFRLNGLATGAVALEFAAELPRDVELTFSASSSDSTALSNMTLSIEWQQGGETASLLPGETGTIPRGATGITVKLSIPIAKRFSNAIVYLQAERGSAATAFEAYSGTAYPVSATLRAIPAAEGYSATYTDGDGTRWYADSYNLVTGELTRRVLVAESYTSDTYIETEGGFISTTGELSEGATVYYRGYAEAEEAEAVSVALSSPTSSIFTNGGGWIDAATGSALGISNKTPTNITGLLKGDGAAVSAAVANTDYAAPPTAVTLTLPVSGWIADALYVQAVTVSGMRSYKHVIVNPARQVSNWRAYVEAMVRCAEQGYNTLTFAADSLPTEDLEVDVLIFG